MHRLPKSETICTPHAIKLHNYPMILRNYDRRRHLGDRTRHVTAGSYFYTLLIVFRIEY